MCLRFYETWNCLPLFRPLFCLTQLPNVLAPITYMTVDVSTVLPTLQLMYRCVDTSGIQVIHFKLSKENLGEACSHYWKNTLYVLICLLVVNILCNNITRQNDNFLRITSNDKLNIQRYTSTHWGSTYCIRKHLLLM